MTFLGEAATATGLTRICPTCTAEQSQWKGEKTGELVWLPLFGCAVCTAEPSDG